MKTVNLIPNYDNLFKQFSAEAKRELKAIVQLKGRKTDRSTIHNALYSLNMALMSSTTSEDINIIRDILSAIVEESHINLPHNKGLRKLKEDTAKIVESKENS